jgi:hypothetical protein
MQAVTNLFLSVCRFLIRHIHPHGVCALGPTNPFHHTIALGLAMVTLNTRERERYEERDDALVDPAVDARQRTNLRLQSERS